MPENLPNSELADRLNLIETMIAEGRRTSQGWSWTFLLWGVAYYVAIAWADFGKAWYAWPATMIAAAIVTAVLASRSKRGHPGTTVGRAISAVWSVMGTALFVVLIALYAGARIDAHVSIAIIAAMLAVANGISGIVLRWKMQIACAVVWLAAAVGACFTTDAQLMALFLAAIFFCQIVFGIYGMVLESRGRARSAVHG